MNNYDFSKVEPEKAQSGNISPYLTYGSGQVLKINSIELKESQNTHAPKAILHMESKPINDATFAPIDGALGRVGRIGCGPYMNSELLKREFLQKMKTIAASLGLENEVNRIKSEKFEEVVSRVSDLLKGKYARYTIVAAEYPKADGKVGITLSLPKFKFVESENADPSTIVIFDKDNQYHYKKIVAGSTGYSNSGYLSNSFAQPAISIYNTPSNLGNPSDHVDDPSDDLPF